MFYILWFVFIHSPSQFRLATVPVLNSHMWPVATVLDRAEVGGKKSNLGQVDHFPLQG